MHWLWTDIRSIGCLDRRELRVGSSERVWCSQLHSCHVEASSLDHKTKVAHHPHFQEIDNLPDLMEKRKLKVVKWIGTAPVAALCTYCSRDFNVPLDSLKRTSDAQESLRKQFAEHKCKLVDDTPARLHPA
jgi:hypothetical protein